MLSLVPALHPCSWRMSITVSSSFPFTTACHVQVVPLLLNSDNRVAKVAVATSHAARADVVQEATAKLIDREGVYVIPKDKLALVKET